MAPEALDSDAELERLRNEKLQRYRRVAALTGDHKEFPDQPVEASVAAAEEVVRSFPTAVIEFWAKWCRPCHTMRPIVDELAAEFWGDIAFARLDIDAHPDARTRWDVTVLPTVVLTQKGHEAARLLGAQSRRKLETFLEPFASSPDERLKRRGTSQPPGRVGGA